VSGFPWLIITGSGLVDWIHSCLFTSTLSYNQCSAIADLHIFQFTAAHALGLSVSTSRILATDLNTETITSNHYEVLSFSSSNTWTADFPELNPILHFQSPWFLTLYFFVLISLSDANTPSLYRRGRDHIQNISFCCQNCCRGVLELCCLPLGTLLLRIRCLDSVYRAVAWQCFEQIRHNTKSSVYPVSSILSAWMSLGETVKYSPWLLLGTIFCLVHKVIYMWYLQDLQSYSSKTTSNKRQVWFNILSFL
jgi:hypothetical protein